MHWYDPQTGLRVEEILKKDGTPYKAVPRKIINERGYVPGVTDIMKYSSPYFWLARYERMMGIKGAIELVHNIHGIPAADESEVVAVNEWVRDMLDEPANAGTIKHYAFEKGVEGTVWDVQGGEPYQTIARETMALTRLLWPPETYRYDSEFMFACQRYGGTMDLVVRERESGRPVALVDAKFPTKERKCTSTELIQIAAYEKYLANEYKSLTGRNDCEIMPANWMYRADGYVYLQREYTREQVEAGWAMFQSLLDGWERLRKIDEVLRGSPSVTITNTEDVS